MLKIKEGQKAVIVGNENSFMHCFEDGEIVEFIEYGFSDEKEKYYEYEFKNENGLEQSLVELDFKLCDSNNCNEANS